MFAMRSSPEGCATRVDARSAVARCIHAAPPCVDRDDKGADETGAEEMAMKIESMKIPMKRSVGGVLAIAAILVSVSTAPMFGQGMTKEKSLYDRLGGKPAITAVVD